jgi:N-acetylglucosaminyldiphosphoundecaprenol N-acetyl-beta-D-mannosaminyltransferase
MYTIATENILGYQIAVTGKNTCTEHIMSWIDSGNETKCFVCANPHSLIIAETDSFFRKAIQAADLLTPDGVGIVLASKILGGRIQERVTGSNIFSGLSKALNNKSKGKFSYFFLGSTDKTLAAIKNKMAEDYPNIRFAGSYSPPFKAEFNKKESQMMIEAVNSARPDVLWVGFPKRKEIHCSKRQMFIL